MQSIHLHKVVLFLLIFISIILLPISNTVFADSLYLSYFLYISIVYAAVHFNKDATWLVLFYSLVLFALDLINYKYISAETIFNMLCLLAVSLIVGIQTKKRTAFLNDLQEKGNELRTVTEASLDVISKINSNGIFEFVTPSVIGILGYQPNEIIGKSFYSFVYESDKANVKKLLDNVLYSMEKSKFECRLIKKDGSTIWIESLINPIKSENNVSATVYVFGSRDITERKSMEALLKNYSYSDYLTGLYNRRYLDKAIDELNIIEDEFVGLFICDVDGVKIVNDILGHRKGDELLLEAADVLTRTFLDGCIISRFGGDEFAVLVKGATQEKLEQYHKLLKKNIADLNVNEGSGYLFLSAGYARRKHPKAPLNELFIDADNNMYNEKTANRAEFKKTFSEKFIQI